MNVPDKVREKLKQQLWSLADAVEWLNLSATAKSRYYEFWTRDAEIGGVLMRYIGLGKVRVYIKDTLLKDYGRNRIVDESMIYQVLALPTNAEAVKRYIKPHGFRLSDGRVICWGKASVWKAILMTAYERGLKAPDSSPFAVILTQAVGRYKQTAVRSMIEEAARRLGLTRVEWIDT